MDCRHRWAAEPRASRVRATGKDSSGEAREAAALPATLRAQLLVSYLRHVIAAAMSDQQHVVRREEEEVEQAAGATDDAAQLEETRPPWPPRPSCCSISRAGESSMLPSAARPSNQGPQARDPLPHHLQRDASSHAQKAASYVSARGRSSRHVVRLRRLPCAAYSHSLRRTARHAFPGSGHRRGPAMPLSDAWRRQSSSVLQQKREFSTCTLLSRITFYGFVGGYTQLSTSSLYLYMNFSGPAIQ